MLLIFSMENITALSSWKTKVLWKFLNFLTHARAVQFKFFFLWKLNVLPQVLTFKTITNESFNANNQLLLHRYYRFKFDQISSNILMKDMLRIWIDFFLYDFSDCKS